MKLTTTPNKSFPLLLRILPALFLPVLASFPSEGLCGLSVTSLGATSPTSLVTALVGNGVSVSNVTYQGTKKSSGTFTGGNAAIGFPNGIILSSGDAASVVGNDPDSASVTLNIAGDTDLETLNGGTLTHDATVLEFDFVPVDGAISFDYVFGSEEYNRYVGSIYNDVFGFFVNGVNVALLPGTATDVSINNVNNCVNSAYYVNNSSSNGSTFCSLAPPSTGRKTVLNGLTTVLSVTALVTPGVVNHIKLAIADSGDYAVDSDVFIRSGSFVSVDPSATWTPTPSITPTPTPRQSPTPLCDPKIWPDPFSRRFAVGGTVKIDCVGPKDVVQIFTIAGEMVAKNLVPTGGGPSDRVEWDGRNEKGVPVVSGVYYFVVLEGDKPRKTGKFLIQDAR